MRVVLAGFGPFPGAPINPSAVLVRALSRRRRPALAGLSLKAHAFATTYAGVDRDLPKLFAEKPDIVLMFGLAARSRQIRIETRARNAVSVLFPDASGYRPDRNIIASGAPPVLRGNAPFARLLAALRSSAVPGRLSRDAGRYVCNYAYWRALRHSRSGHRPLIQFVHIPPVAPAARPRRTKYPPPSLAALTRGTENLLIALVAASRR
jgi:pyroglutamyl-peptidase